MTAVIYEVPARDTVRSGSSARRRMLFRARAIRSVLLVALIDASITFVPRASDLVAQGVTTAALGGTVRTADGTNVDGARVSVVHAATGLAVESTTRNGRFLVHGLPIGGPYTITVSLIGFRPRRLEGLYIRLGESSELRFVIEPAPIPLDPVHVMVPAPFARANADGGTATTVGDSTLHRLPTLNRNLYDFVGLAPQISTRIGFAPGGMSGAGVGFRFNNFLIDGVPERSVPGNQPPEFAGGKSLPFEAVSELRLLLAPFDVRYGDFAGALVNVVTRSGTNQFHASVYSYARSDALARGGGGAAIDPYERWLYGFSLGGPIRRDRAHFFVASEFQRLTWPAPGPFVGQPVSETAPAPVPAGDLARLDRIMSGNGLVAGSGGPVQNSNPLRNVFARVDLAIPERNSRAVLQVNEARTRNRNLTRVPGSSFPLSTQQPTHVFGSRTLALQLHTGLARAGGGHNELFISHRSLRSEVRAAVQQPIVRVQVPGPTGSPVTVVSGPPRQAHGGATNFRDLNLRNNLTLPLGTSHVATLGVEMGWFRADASGLLNAYGTWTFSSLDSLEAGLARSYEVVRDFGGAGVPLTGAHHAAYAGDRWRVGERVSLTMGVRAEMLYVDGRPPYNARVDSVFGLRTDAVLRPRVHLSPRFGFTWDLTGTARDRLRGGAGIFTGRPPMAWIHAALTRYGVGTGVLRCGPSPQDLGPAPAFVPDHRTPPAACGDGSSPSTPPAGEVMWLDRRLRMAQTLRGALAYDRHLRSDLTGTIELLATRNISDFVFVNLNLGEPLAADRHGRVLYGRIEADGTARPIVRDSVHPSVVELRHQSSNHSYQLSGRLEKRFTRGLAATASYTYSRVRDVQTPLRINVEGSVNWAARAVSGRHDDLRTGISLNDVPHRVVVAGTYRAPWPGWSTELSVLYVGEAGSPFTYLAYGVGERGDLNADGSDTNDPIFVPRSALDRAEIIFSGQSDSVGADNSPAAQAERELRQRAAFEAFIDRTPCLRHQRGRILARNSCREPWSHTTIGSIRQAVPVAGRALEAQLDIFNVLNLLGAGWGQRRVALPQVLEHVGHTPEPPGQAQPIFRLDDRALQWQRVMPESSFQLQLALRYRF